MSTNPEIIDSETGEIINPENQQPGEQSLALVAPAFEMDPEAFKKQFDGFMEIRRYMLSRIEEIMVEGADFHVIKGKRVLGKPGAEKLAAIFKLRATFEVDGDTMVALGLTENGVAYKCSLRVNGDGPIVGQGIGVRLLSADRGDGNKTVKMAKKSAHIDAVISTTGVSDLFTLDLDDEPAHAQATGTGGSAPRDKADTRSASSSARGSSSAPVPAAVSPTAPPKPPAPASPQAPKAAVDHARHASGDVDWDKVGELLGGASRKSDPTVVDLNGAVQLGTRNLVYSLLTSFAPDRRDQWMNYLNATETEGYWRKAAQKMEDAIKAGRGEKKEE